MCCACLASAKGCCDGHTWSNNPKAPTLPQERLTNQTQEPGSNAVKVGGVGIGGEGGGGHSLPVLSITATACVCYSQYVIEVVLIKLYLNRA
jgi:hypothetical protein